MKKKSANFTREIYAYPYWYAACKPSRNITKKKSPISVANNTRIERSLFFTILRDPVEKAAKLHMQQTMPLITPTVNSGWRPQSVPENADHRKSTNRKSRIPVAAMLTDHLPKRLFGLILILTGPFIYHIIVEVNVPDRV